MRAKLHNESSTMLRKSNLIAHTRHTLANISSMTKSILNLRIRSNLFLSPQCNPILILLRKQSSLQTVSDLPKTWIPVHESSSYVNQVANISYPCRIPVEHYVVEQ